LWPSIPIPIYGMSARSGTSLPQSDTGIVLLAAVFLPLPAAVGPTTAVLVLLVILAIVGLLAARSRAASRTGAGAGSAGPRPAKLEPNLVNIRIADDDPPPVEERFRTPLDQVESYAIVLLDTKGRPTSWNSGIRRVLGYDKAEFLLTAAADLYPADARESGAPAADLGEAARRGQYITERWLVRKDGNRFWGSVSTTSVQDRDGRLLGFARRLRDLTESKQAEERIHRQQQALELALEAAGLGTWEHELSTGADSMDGRARVLFGIPADEPLTTTRWREAIHPEDRDRTIERWETAVREGSQYSAEYRVVWPDGSIHWVMALGRCVTEPSSGAPLLFAGVVLDLTERRRTEEHLQESLRLEAVGRLAGGIAHDLNNMLAAILGFGDLLGRSFEPDDPRAADVEQMCRAAARSAGLTRQLLAFARRELIQPRALDINLVIQHAQALLPPILGENVELELRLAPDLGVVYADARQIEQIVMNLVLNARDAMPQGGQVTIETTTVQLGPGMGAWLSEEERAMSGRFTRLSVTDTGHGMDAATLQRIWEPFFTTKPRGQGTGLGLASVYGSAKQSGGFVWADSQPGSGTTVQVYWPEIRGAAESFVEPDRLPPIEGGSEAVLVVEDEELVRALAVRALRSFGYACLQARDADEALLLLGDNGTRVDLVITDVVMPGMSGRELGDRLAQLRPGIPVIYTSGFTDEDVIRRGMLEEGRPFLQKPFTPHDLARAVREALDVEAAGRGESPT
jgi:two-component system cell cycle sensor histidine kinase/response regulator CckA